MAKSFFSFRALESARSAGYQSTATALAELIDNSFDANAKTVVIAFFEQQVQGERRRVNEIAVLDDGSGMADDLLGSCLQFGAAGEENLDVIVRSKRKGKFGFGLPNASLSQCPNVHVFSRRDDVGAWRSTYLKLEELKISGSTDIPDVREVVLPVHVANAWRDSADGLRTVVLWKDCDRLSRVKAETLIRDAEEFIGRIYRYQLSAGLKIIFRVYEYQARNHSYRASQPEVVAQANDPLFLMPDTFISRHLYTESMNHNGSDPNADPAVYYGQFSEESRKCKPTNEVLEDCTFDFPFSWNGRIYGFKITTSTADRKIQKPGIREGGRTRVGEFYGRMKSISFVRADREIMMDNFGFYKETDPRNRWWHIQVSFGADADDLLGVHNNKQTLEFKKTEAHDDDGFDNMDIPLMEARARLWSQLSSHIGKSIKAARKKIFDLETEWTLTPTGVVEGAIPTPTTMTIEATKEVDGERRGQFSKEEREALATRLKEKFAAIGDLDIQVAIDKFDAWMVRGVVLYHASGLESGLWTFSSVLGFLIVLVNTDHEFFRRVMGPLRASQSESHLAALELFISSLAFEESRLGAVNESVQNTLEDFRGQVGLHLRQYLRKVELTVPVSGEEAEGGAESEK